MSRSVCGEKKKPLVAVFISQRNITNLKMQRKDNNFKVNQIVKANRLADTTLFFFSVNSIDFEKSKINGMYFDDYKNIWVEKSFPFPDVLYDRVKRVKTFNITGDEIRKKFDNMGIKKINSRHYFDKLDLYNIFMLDENLNKHLPLTKHYQGVDDLKDMLNQFNKIYLKGCRGSRGKQVLSVASHPDGGYELRSYKNIIAVEKASSLLEIDNLIKSHLAGNRIIVQQAIDLITKDDCIVDFRAELQKDGNGRITITAIPARVGKIDSPITTRGACYSFESFFEQIMGLSEKETAALKSKFEAFLINIYNYLEKSYGPFGELGIDVALDKSGKLWFIECNAKSAKVSLCKTARGETLQKAFLQPLEYAKYIHEQK